MKFAEQIKQQALALAAEHTDKNALSSTRQTALERLTAASFPHRRVEAWKYTSVRALEAGHLTQVASPIAAAQLPESRFDHRLVFINGIYCQESSTALPAGVNLTLIDGSFPISGPEAELTTPFALLNSATLSQGAILTVPANTVVEAPVEVLFYSQADTPSHCQVRLQVKLGENSEFALLEHYAGQGPVLTNAVTTLAGDAYSQLVHYRVQREQTECLHIGTLITEPGAHSEFQSFQLMHGTALRRNDVRVIIAHENVNFSQQGVFVGAEKNHTDNQVSVEHRVPNSVSKMIYKGMAAGQSTLTFNGSIHIHDGASQTVADLTNNNLLLNRGATVNSKPELIIYNDDVQCSHGTTFGQLDEDAIFYLRSRGIDAQAAENILSIAFIDEVLHAMPSETLAEWARPWLVGVLANARVEEA